VSDPAEVYVHAWPGDPVPDEHPATLAAMTRIQHFIVVSSERSL